MGYPTWLVDNGKSQLDVDDLGVPQFQETSLVGFNRYLVGGFKPSEKYESVGNNT